MGWWRAIGLNLCYSDSSELEMTRSEGVHNFQVIDYVHGVHVFGVEDTASTLLRGVNNHRIPIPEMVKLMEIYSCENIAEIWLKPQQPREKCDALPCKLNIQVHFATCVVEVFSKNLQGNGAGLLRNVLLNKLDGNLSLFRVARIICVEKNVRVQKYARICHSSGNALRKFRRD